MNFMKKLGVLALLAQAVAVSAADNNGWSMRLGASYRSFQDVDFNSVPFRNWGNQAGVTGPFGVQGYALNPVYGLPIPALPPAPKIVVVVPVQEVMYNGGTGDIDSEEGFAPVIGVAKELVQVGPFILSLAANLQYYSPESDSTERGNMVDAGNFTATQYTYNLWTFGGVPPDMLIFSGGVAVPPIPGSGTQFSLQNRFDMDLWVLDAGLEARTDFDCFSLNLALGPSLNITNVETSQTQQASWAGIPGIDAGATGSYSQKVTDRETDFIPGLYGAIGISFNLNEKWAVGAEYRYDWVNEEPGTDQGKIDLTGSSAQLKVTYKF